MPTSTEFIAAAKRDAKVVLALSRALYSLTLLHGVTVDIEGFRGDLNLECDIANLSLALRLLGVDPDTLPEPVK